MEDESSYNMLQHDIADGACASVGVGGCVHAYVCMTRCVYVYICMYMIE